MAYQDKESRINELAKSLAGLLSYSLPLVQFFYQLLPSPAGSIFPDQKTLLITSVLTLVISFLIIIWYKLHPFIFIKIFWWQQKAWNNYLEQASIHKDNPEKLKELKRPNPITYVTEKHLTLFAIFLIFFLGARFTWITLNKPTEVTSFFVFEQAILYSILIVLAVLSATIFYETQSFKEESEERRRRRSSKAIALAIENNAIGSIPKVQFLEARSDGGFPENFFVKIQVGKTKYEIKTDSNAEILYSTSKISEDTVEPHPSS